MANNGRIIAKCGLDCMECGAYKATIDNSDDLRKKTAGEWSAMFNADIDWKTINCLGCQQKNKGKLFSHCLVCGIRTCAVERGYATCADCPDFGCDKVSEIWRHAPGSKTNLEQLRT
ncbi:MAG: DUF3795 domain-containing protein [Spirochaetales bacterium]|nr:DUF3795 domain-containing protein [Spirochaetales bacterium]